MGVNVNGVAHGVVTFGPLLVEQGEGHIVNTASIAGFISAEVLGLYCASKHAVVRAHGVTVARVARDRRRRVGVVPEPRQDADLRIRTQPALPR